MKNKILLIFTTCLVLCGCKNYTNSDNYTSNTSQENNSNSSTFDSSEFIVNTNNISNGTIKTNKETYKKGELVKLTIQPNDGYYLEENSLKYGNTFIDDSFSFVMPNYDVSITANFLKDDLPDNYIHGLNISGTGIWNMAMINYDSLIDLTHVTALVVEVKFNQIIENCYFRLAAMTSDGTIYDAFGIDGNSTFYYSCDMDHYNAAVRYSWTTGNWGGWMPTWDTNTIKTAPTFYVEVPMHYMYARFNKYGDKVVQDGRYLNSTKKLAALGIHLTGNGNYNFSIGKTYVRENGVVKHISNPSEYTLENTEIYKIDPTGIYNSTLNRTVYNHVNRFKDTNKMLICGDSIMTKWWSNDLVKNLANKFNASLIRDTQGGTTIRDYDLSTYNDSLIEHVNQGLYDRYVKNNGEFDYIIIQRGTNDLYYANHSTSYDNTMGDINSKDVNTVYGSIRTLIDYFHNLCPNAKIVVSNVLYRNDKEVSDAQVCKYNEDLKTIIDSYDYVNYFDIYNLSGINSANCETYLNSLSNPHSNKSSADYLHPNDQGALLLEKTWIDYLESIF